MHERCEFLPVLTHSGVLLLVIPARSQGQLRTVWLTDPARLSLAKARTLRKALEFHHPLKDEFPAPRFACQG